MQLEGEVHEPPSTNFSLAYYNHTKICYHVVGMMCSKLYLIGFKMPHFVALVSVWLFMTLSLAGEKCGRICFYLYGVWLALMVRKYAH